MPPLRDNNFSAQAELVSVLKIATALLLELNTKVSTAQFAQKIIYKGQLAGYIAQCDILSLTHSETHIPTITVFIVFRFVVFESCFELNPLNRDTLKLTN